MSISERRAEQAIENLASTDEAYAQAKSLTKGLEYRLKVCKAIAFLGASGTVAEKEAAALSSAEYIEILDEYQSAMLDMETLGAKRKKEELIWEHWRSVNANRRAGG